MPLTMNRQAILKKDFPQPAPLKELLSFVEQKKRLALIVQKGIEGSVSSLQERLLKEIQPPNGQFTALNLQDFDETSFVAALTAALNQTGSFRVDLPFILQGNPNTESPFVNRAILWQRLCDKLIEEENPERPTVLLLENAGCADKKVQHDIARQIRFHDKYHIRRTFLLTMRQDEMTQLEPELQELVTGCFIAADEEG